MRKSILTLSLCAALLCGASQLMAAEAAPETANAAGNPVDQFTGRYWEKSTLVNKEAYLFGIESAIAVDYFIERQTEKKGAKSPSVLSHFEKGWMKAFANVTRKEIVADVDAWYAAHPQELDKPVLSVLWHDVIVPRLDAQAGK